MRITIYWLESFAIFNIGFNLSTNSETTNQQENLEDPSIYGGNDEVPEPETMPAAGNPVALAVLALMSIVGVSLKRKF